MLYAGQKVKEIYNHLNDSVYCFDFYDIYVDYGEEGAVIHANTPKKIYLQIKNGHTVPAMLIGLYVKTKASYVS